MMWLCFVWNPLNVSHDSLNYVYNIMYAMVLMNMDSLFITYKEYLLHLIALAWETKVIGGCKRIGCLENQAIIGSLKFMHVSK